VGRQTLVTISRRPPGTVERERGEKFGGDVEAAAEAFDVVLVEIAPAAQDFGDDTGDAAISEARRPNTETQRTRRKKERRKGCPGRTPWK